MNWLGVIILCALFLLAAPGRRDRRRDLYLAGQRASAAAIAGSFLATCLGASATLGFVARAYDLGWVAFWWLGAGCAGLVLLALFWVEPIRSHPGIRSLPQWLGTGYGRPARTLAAGIIVVMWTAVIAAQWVAAGTLLHGLVHLPLWAGIALAAGVVGAYTAWGGQTSVLRTDGVQAVLIGLAILLAVVAVLRLPVAAATMLPAPSALLWSAAVPFPRWSSLLLVVGGMYVVGPDMCSRVLAARDAQAARRGALAAALLLLPCAVGLAFVGVALRRAGVGPTESRQALPFLLSGAGLLPSWAGMAALLGLLAAVFSSADTCLLTAATVLDLDLLDRNRGEKEQHAPGRIRFLIGGVAVASALVAWRSPRIIPNLLLAYAFYAGGLLAPLLLLVSARGCAAVPRSWVWAGMAAGGTVPVLLLVTGRVSDYAVAGAVGCVLCTAILVLGAAWAWLRSQRRRRMYT